MIVSVLIPFRISLNKLGYKFIQGNSLIKNNIPHQISSRAFLIHLKTVKFDYYPLNEKVKIGNSGHDIVINLKIPDFIKMVLKNMKPVVT